MEQIDPRTVSSHFRMHESTRQFNLIDRTKQIAAGLTLSALALGGGALVAEGGLSMTNDIAVVSEHAQPSSLLGEGFTLLEDAGAAVGAAVLLKRGLKHIRLAFDEEEYALNNVAHNLANTKRMSGHKVPRAIAACSVLTSFTGIVAGNFFDVSNNVSKTQSNVAQLFNNLTPHGHDSNFVISDNPTPDILNTSNINGNQISEIERQAKADGTNIIPIHFNWSGGSYSNSKPNSYNLEFLTIGIPDSMTHIPRADANCNDVEANVSSDLGVKPGGFFELQGLKVWVNKLIKGDTGFNLLPVVMNNSDYDRCLLTDTDTSDSMLIAHGNRSQVMSMTDSVDDHNIDPSKRLYAISTKDFVNNAENTGKNVVNGLVMEAMAIGMALGAIALSHKMSQELANNRNRNRMLLANGYDWHKILRIYHEKAEANAVASAIVAMPGTLIVDTLVNHTQPGGALGINLETYAAVTGFLWAINRLSTSIAVRREARIIDNERSEL